MRAHGQIALSAAVFSETKAVLARPKFARALGVERQRDILELLSAASVWIEPKVRAKGFLAGCNRCRAANAADIKRRLRGRPRMEAPKHLVSLRLDPDVVARLRETEPGWQSRINAVLPEHLPEVAE